MKLSVFSATILACLASAVLSLFFPSSVQAGAPTGDDIIIFRSTFVDRSTLWFQTGVDMPDGKYRDRYRATGYLILNLATGEFREVSYWTATQRNLEGKRVRVKRYDASDSDRQAQAMFQTGPDDRRNYLLLSLYGSGMGENFTFADAGNDLFTRVNSETLEGLMRVQRIRTDAGVMECIAPSTVRGTTGEESQNIQRDSGGEYQERQIEEGRKTLRLDKRRITDAKNAGADSLESFQAIVIEYLESRGYEAGPMS